MSYQHTEYHKACSTKAKRAALATELKKLALAYGATVERDDPEGPMPSTYTLAFAKGPYKVFFDLSGKSRVGAFLAHWHTESKSDAKYPKDFGYTIVGSVNEYHYAKATTCTNTLEAFRGALASGLAALQAP